MLTFANVTLLATTTAAALVAGLLYAYSCSVNPGLAKLTDEQYVAAMQSINKAIQNPLFFASFMGTLILLPVCTFMQYSQPVPVRFWLLLTATVLYGVSVMGITMFGNVPLNNGLEQFRVADASATDIHAARLKFETAWNSFHSVRTFGSVITLILLILACLSNRK